MRPIGILPDEAQARRFEDHLQTLEIQSMVEAAAGGWEVWIHDDHHLEQAGSELEQFRAEPDHPRYDGAGDVASDLREEKKRQRKAARARQIDVRTQWQQPAIQRCPVTVALIGISVIVAVLSSLGENHQRMFYLFILPLEFDGDGAWKTVSLTTTLLRGEVWRLFTPMFIHFGLLHLIFNMMWLWSLGTAIEARRGSLKYVLIVLTIAGGSDILQYLWSGPLFGGMSGVVYGLFGYIWVKSRCDPTDTMHMPQSTVFWLMGWFFLCMTGVAGPVANVGHGAGLAFGAGLGYASAVLRQAPR